MFTKKMYAKVGVYDIILYDTTWFCVVMLMKVHEN